MSQKQSHQNSVNEVAKLNPKSGKLILENRRLVAIDVQHVASLRCAEASLMVQQKDRIRGTSRGHYELEHQFMCEDSPSKWTAQSEIMTAVFFCV